MSIIGEGVSLIIAIIDPPLGVRDRPNVVYRSHTNRMALSSVTRSKILLFGFGCAASILVDTIAISSLERECAKLDETGYLRGTPSASIEGKAIMDDRS